MRTAFDRRGFLQSAGLAAASSLVAEVRAKALKRDLDEEAAEGASGDME